jgi:hypothetical protein
MIPQHIKTHNRTTQKAKNINDTDPQKNTGAREGSAVPVSFKTPAALLIYTVKSGKKVLAVID